jgi:chemotaxis protein CheX
MTAVAADDIHQVTMTVWESVLDLALSPTENFRPAGDQVGARVSITGAWHGWVRITCSPTLARRLTGMLFMMEDDEVDDEQMRDALGEVVNMIGGNLKALLPQPSKLGLPEPTAGGDDAIVAAASLECESQPLLVALTGQDVA